MKNVLLYFLILLSINSTAQMSKKELPKGSLSGKVIDKTTNEPLPYVNIIILDLNKKIITGGITNDAGIFKVKGIPVGKNRIEIQFIGYKTISKDITVTNKNLQLGTFALEEDSTTLDEVEVRAEISTVVQKVDRKVIKRSKGKFSESLKQFAIGEAIKQTLAILRKRKK